MRIAIDIDGFVYPESSAFDRCLQLPIDGAVEKVNKLYNDGHQIFFFTARGWNEYNYTLKQLLKDGFKFHVLICGKLSYDIIGDDRAVSNIDELIKRCSCDDVSR
jgi:hypothetical protein